MILDEWSSWKTVGGCSTSCGSGVIKYTRVCGASGRVTSGVFSGRAGMEMWSSRCFGESTKTEPCNKGECRECFTLLIFEENLERRTSSLNQVKMCEF